MVMKCSYLTYWQFTLAIILWTTWQWTPFLSEKLPAFSHKGSGRGSHRWLDDHTPPLDQNGESFYIPFYRLYIYFLSNETAICPFNRIYLNSVLGLKGVTCHDHKWFIYSLILLPIRRILRITRNSLCSSANNPYFYHVIMHMRDVHV